MAGHSKFKNIMHRKGAQDAKRAKNFTKLVKEITVAVKSCGEDIEFNPRLRTAIATAKVQNLPKDRIEAAIKKAANPQQGDNFEEIRYECYAPGGVALVVETVTDNRNRTAGEVKAILSKAGGNLAEPGSVLYMFDHVGEIFFKASAASADTMLDSAIESGAEDCESTEEGHVIVCKSDDFHEVRNNLSKKYGEPEYAKITWKPQTVIEISSDEHKEKLMKIIDMLEDNDDVQDVYTNSNIDEISDK
ncbi:MAG: YebC/PmpR family DNA-binding transcriptional regulator [Rickettsiales bacterium]|nr:YebC/PmpR family DNA-binding transcriptional regulator [Rickettsiales bacterium]